jgi:hypothetical protein
MAGRICRLCSDSGITKRAAELIAEGSSDQKIADQLGLAGHAGRMVVSRHRRFHVEAPAKAIAAAANKGRDVVTQREQTLAAAEAGDPLAFVALAGIVSDLKEVHHRLARTADAAEQDNQRLAVSALSAQQLRAAEVRAKLGGVGAYQPQKAAQINLPGFAVNFIFSGGRTERVAVCTGPVIDGAAIDELPDDALPEGDDEEV